MKEKKKNQEMYSGDKEIPASEIEKIVKKYIPEFKKTNMWVNDEKKDRFLAGSDDGMGAQIHYFYLHNYYGNGKTAEEKNRKPHVMAFSFWFPKGKVIEDTISNLEKMIKVRDTIRQKFSSDRTQEIETDYHRFIHEKVRMSEVFQVETPKELIGTIQEFGDVYRKHMKQYSFLFFNKAY